MKPGAGQGSPLRVAPAVQSDTGQNYYIVWGWRRTTRTPRQQARLRCLLNFLSWSHPALSAVLSARVQQSFLDGVGGRAVVVVAGRWRRGVGLAAFAACDELFIGGFDFVEVVQIIPQERIQLRIWDRGDSPGDPGDSTGAGVRAHRGAGFRCARSISYGEIVGVVRLFFECIQQRIFSESWMFRFLRSWKRP